MSFNTAAVATTSESGALVPAHVFQKPVVRHMFNLSEQQIATIQGALTYYTGETAIQHWEQTKRTFTQILGIGQDLESVEAALAKNTEEQKTLAKAQQEILNQRDEIQKTATTQAAQYSQSTQELSNKLVAARDQLSTKAAIIQNPLTSSLLRSVVGAGRYAAPVLAVITAYVARDYISTGCADIVSTQCVKSVGFTMGPLAVLPGVAIPLYRSLEKSCQEFKEMQENIASIEKAQKEAKQTYEKAQKTREDQLNRLQKEKEANTKRSEEISAKIQTLGATHGNLENQITQIQQMSLGNIVQQQLSQFEEANKLLVSATELKGILEQQTNAMARLTLQNQIDTISESAHNIGRTAVMTVLDGFVTGTATIICDASTRLALTANDQKNTPAITEAPTKSPLLDHSEKDHSA